MAKGRIPGPLSKKSLLGPINDGTSTLNPSPIPGPLRRRRSVPTNKGECDRMNPRNLIFLDWINAHRSDAEHVANSLKSRTEFILGLSALESSYGESRFAREGNNFFGLHTNNKNPLPEQIGIISAKDDPKIGLAKFDSYLGCAQAFAQTKGKLIEGVIDAKQFATILQTKGKFGIGAKGQLPGYFPDLMNVINNITLRIKCS